MAIRTRQFFLRREIINVVEQCINLFKNEAVQKRRKETYLEGEEMLPRIHAMVFNPNTGDLKRIPVSGHKDILLCFFCMPFCPQFSLFLKLFCLQFSLFSTFFTTLKGQLRWIWRRSWKHLWITHFGQLDFQSFSKKVPCMFIVKSNKLDIP